MFSSNRIRLFWWNEIKIQGKSKENYGDLLGKYLVERISCKKVTYAWPNRWSINDILSPIYVTIGSILPHVNNKCIVWGSGIISQDIFTKKAIFLAVRGPKTRQHLLNLGYDVPEIYGDPALLLPRYYKPKVKKTYEFGVIAHYRDFEFVKNFYREQKCVCLIQMTTNDIELKTNEILSCKKIISSSLHGLIVAHAYGIPAIWQKFSDNIFGDDIKYIDYFESVKLPTYKPDIRNTELTLEEMEELFLQKKSLPSKQVIDELTLNLLRVCPFNRENS